MADECVGRACFGRSGLQQRNPVCCEPLSPTSVGAPGALFLTLYCASVNGDVVDIDKVVVVVVTVDVVVNAVDVVAVNVIVDVIFLPLMSSLSRMLLLMLSSSLLLLVVVVVLYCCCCRCCS